MFTALGPMASLPHGRKAHWGTSGTGLRVAKGMKNDGIQIVVRPAAGGFELQLRGLDTHVETYMSHQDLNMLYETDFLVTPEGWLLRFCAGDIVIRRNSACAYTSMENWWRMLLAAESSRTTLAEPTTG